MRCFKVRTCDWCGKEYAYFNSRSMFCSKSCCNNSSRARHPMTSERRKMYEEKYDKDAYDDAVRSLVNLDNVTRKNLSMAVCSSQAERDRIFLEN